MRRPPFPFASVLVQAEENRDTRRRAHQRTLDHWHAQKRAVANHEAALGEVLQAVEAQRAAGPRGAMEQHYLLFLQRERGRLAELRRRERDFAAKAEQARLALFEAILKLRVWETLRERFWHEWETRERRREEALLEDWSRSRLQRTRSRAVV